MSDCTLTRDFPLGCVNWDPLDINGVGGVFWDAEYVLAEHGLNVLTDSHLEGLVLLLRLIARIRIVIIIAIDSCSVKSVHVVSVIYDVVAILLLLL